MQLTKATRRTSLVIAIAALTRSAAADDEATAPPPPEAPSEATEPPQPSHPPQRWVKVPYGAIAASRTQGTDDLEPDDETKGEIAGTGRRAVGAFRICLDDQGAVTMVHAVKPTGFLAYDEQIRRELGAWRFRPPGLADRSRAVCAVVAVAYPPGKVEPYDPSAAAPAAPAAAAEPQEPGTLPPLPPIPPRRRLAFLFRGGFDFGGAKLIELRSTDGDSATLKAGQLVWCGVGFLFQAAAPWSLDATIGYKGDGRSGSTGSAGFARFPLDIILSFAARGHRLGVGSTIHFSPKFTCDAGVCGVAVEIPLDTSIGLLAQWAYGIRRSKYGMELGARYTRLSYQGKGIDSFDGSSFGFFVGTWL